MNDKIQTALFILFFVLLIGIMSWSSMHPSPISTTSHDLYANRRGYYIDKKESAGAVPENDLPLIIAQGEFKYAPNGKTSFIRQGIPPMLFAQRDTYLLLKFDTIPKNYAETFSKIDALLQDWIRQGTSSSALVLDYRPRHPDFVAYSNFINALNKHLLLSGVARSIHAMADVSWIGQDNSSPKNYKLITKGDYNFKGLVFEIHSMPLSPALLQKLANFDEQFQLKLLGTELMAEKDIKSLQKISGFEGYWVTLDPRKPFVEKRATIGLFPKL